MSEIKKETFSFHPLIEVIDTALDNAVKGQASISDFALNVSGMSGTTYRKFINNYAKSIENPTYLEIGTWKGSTLCSAIDGVENIKAVAVDNFSYGGATLDDVNHNVASTRTQSADITILNQNFEDFDFTAHGKFKIYLYDGGHTEQDQYNGIVRAIPAFEQVTLVIIDDWDTQEVKDGTYRALAKPSLEVLHKVIVDAETKNGAGTPDWHCGYGIFLVRVK